MTARTRILFVDDEQCVLSGLERMLFDQEDEWEMQFVTSGKEALAAFQQQPFDVIVTDMRMPEMDGAQLLMSIQQRWPASVRIILSGQAEKEAVLRSIGPAHRFLPKPCNSRLLYETIQNASRLHRSLQPGALKELVATQWMLPAMPEMYHLLINEMRTPQPSIDRVAELISADTHLCNKLLQIVNSALHDKPLRLSSAWEVIRTIGVDRLRPLVLAAGIFSHFPTSEVVDKEDEQFIDHCATVSRLAQAIVEREMPGDCSAVGTALLAGLIHDVGKLVLHQAYGASYRELLKRQYETDTPICQSESAALGVDHAAVGAYLLSLWGIPDSIIEVVAYHHAPQLSKDTQFSPLTAVHVANVLDNAQRFGQREQFDLVYLERIQVTNKLKRWRDLMPSNRNSWFYPAMIDGSGCSLSLSSSS